MCTNGAQNPYCLETQPTDPYNWIFYGTQWYYAQTFTGIGLANTVYKYQNQFYYCDTGCNGPPVTSNSNSSQDSNGFTPVLNQSPVRPLYEYAATCQVQSGPTGQYAPMPNARTGSCEKTALNDPCASPCIRLENGQLAINSNSGNCRVFPNVTQGGNASYLNSSCPTVCPSACVELWQSCPPGTGPLTTLAQTKTPIDLLSLTGPYRQDGAVNALWPANYANTQNSVRQASAVPMSPSTSALLGKPYTECYAYNTQFCDLPMGTQRTAISLDPPSINTQCFASCPAGTYPDPSNNANCLFLPTDGTAPGDITSSTSLQKVFCNPQYFNPVYFADKPGIQRGCESRGLPSKMGSSCPQGTSPLVNEFFNLEWCTPDCPAGYFFDLSQSTCVATCQGLGATSSATGAGTLMDVYNTFIDYVNFYATTGRCTKGTNCVQELTPGRCPVPTSSPMNSRLLGSSQNQSDPALVKIRASAINTQCAIRQAKNGQTGQNGQSVSIATNFIRQVASSQAANPDQPLGDCPPGMAFGASECLENPNLCYDVCQDGYEPVSFCNNGQTTCGPDQLIYACRALCPSHKEGLGPWSELNSDPLYTCTYNYPGGPPSDPNLWVQCPDDGRFTTLSSTTSTDTKLSAAARLQPLCVRRSYLRQTTCPIGYTEIGSECIAGCDANDALVTMSDGTIVCQSSSGVNSSRHDNDLASIVDRPNTKGPFQNHVLVRKSFSRGVGTDPNSGLTDSGSGAFWSDGNSYAGILAGAGILAILILMYVFIKAAQALAGG